MQKTTLTVTNEKGHKMTLVGTIDDKGVALEYKIVDNTGEPMSGMESTDDPFALFRLVDKHMRNLTQLAEQVTQEAQAEHEAQDGGVDH